MMSKKTYLMKATLFIAISGIASGLLLILNYLLIYVIGYGVVYTGLLTILIIMYFILRLYNSNFDKKLKVRNSIFIGLPIFIIATMVNFVVSNYDYSHSVTYEYYSNGYFLNCIEETGKQFIPLAVFFSFVFIPINNFLKQKREINYSK